MERNEKKDKKEEGDEKKADTDTKNNLKSKESTDTLVFNSNVYDSIFKENENCLSVFSFDKESTINEDKDEGINKIINTFNTIDYSINNNNKREITHNNNKNKLLCRSLNIDNFINNKGDKDNEDTNSIILEKDNNNKSNKIYKRKKTPNNLINSRPKIVSSSHHLRLRNQLINEEFSNYESKTQYINNSNNESASLSLNNTKKGIYKKIKLNMIENSKKESGHSYSFMGLSRKKPIISKSLAISKPNKTAVILNNEKDKVNKTVINKINEIPIKINILIQESLPSRIKVNTKKIERRNTNSIINNKLILDTNKYTSFHHHKPKLTFV
jgi:hypothetical protein